VNRPPKVPRPSPVPRVPSRSIARLRAVDVPAFWADLDTLPLVEPGARSTSRLVTFCWRDDHAESVLLFANRLTDETTLEATLLERVPGSDLWHASFEMDSDWRASYSFLVQRPGGPAPWLADGHVALRAALDQGLPDPLNPASCVNRAGTRQSVVSLPDAPPQPWLTARADTPRGSLTRCAAPDGRAVWLYDPPGRPLTEPLPLLVALDGEVWTQQQSLPTTLDNLIADGAIPAMRAALPSSVNTSERWRELADDTAGVSLVLDDVVPLAARLRGVRRDRVVIAGQSLGGLTALRCGLTRPAEVAGVVSQSASLWHDDLSGLVTRGNPARIHLTHGTQEWVLDQPHRDLATRLHDAGTTLHAATHNGGHDYAWWRGAIAEGLAWVATDWAGNRQVR